MFRLCSDVDQPKVAMQVADFSKMIVLQLHCKLYNFEKSLSYCLVCPDFLTCDREHPVDQLGNMLI